MQTSRRSTLKSWSARAVKSGKRELVGITCPNCGGKAIVSKKWLDKNLLPGYLTRACTYCFKAAWIPGEHPDEKEAV